MDILTLLKANIRHRKGSFISIIFLMLIISMSLVSILSIKDNCRNSIENAHKMVDSCDVSVTISDKMLTDELRDKVENHPFVERVKDYKIVVSNKVTYGTKEDLNSWRMMKLQENVKIMNEDLSEYEKSTPKLNKGEIYIPQGIISNLKCKVGDKLTIKTFSGDYDFVIKGVALEPMTGGATIGWKKVYISDEDFEKIYKETKKSETDEKIGTGHMYEIYKSKDCELSIGKFKRQLNLDTGIINVAEGSIAKDMSIYYTNLFPDMCGDFLIVFVMILLVIMLIIIGHSISSSIEMDYVNLGILKAVGFSKNKIRLIFIVQYLLAELVGALIGIILCIPLIKVISGVFQPIMAIIIDGKISFGKSLFIIVGIILVSMIFIIVITKKIGKISPVRAISGGKSEIYFDSRLNVPISKRGLSFTLAVRQFTSGKKRYISTILISSLLVFFMMTVTLLSNVLTSKNALELMGIMCVECTVQFKDELSDEQLSMMEKEIEKITPINKAYFITNNYFSVEGEEIMGIVHKNPEVIKVFKGRAPIYDNEIVITEIIADEFDLKIGDEVSIAYKEGSEKYIISGIFQSTNDVGRVFAVSLKGVQKIGFNNIYSGGYSLENPEKSTEVEDMLNEKFGDLILAKVYDIEADMGMINIAAEAIKYVIYGFSIIFTFVVVAMVCSKAFVREKTDIGIYKAIGFSSLTLRLHFALRFLIVSVMGSIIGYVTCVLCSENLLNSLLRGMGVTNIIVEYTKITVLIPVAIICICFFLFSFIVSGKVKRVQVRELVTE
ncbi:MAG: FtsX-like permease family protein [Lachnospiraceae bacterium]|nr:FtsX-like permease family protein [Lachnospiraceae bacterium]